MVQWKMVGSIWQVTTLPKTDVAPKNDGFQYESPFPRVYFQVLC